MCGLTEEPVTAHRAVRFPLSVLSVAAEDVKQLLTHLVSALTELNCHYRHFQPRKTFYLGQ